MIHRPTRRDMLRFGAGAGLSLLARDARAGGVAAAQMLDFETSSNGTVMTDSILSSSVQGQALGTWQTLSDPPNLTPGATPYVTIATAASRNLPGTVTINGSSYSTTGSRGMAANMRQNVAVYMEFTSACSPSSGTFFKWAGPSVNWNPRDVVGLYAGNGYFQFWNLQDDFSTGKAYIRIHYGEGGELGNNFEIQRDHWYWITTKWLYGAGTLTLSVYDAENSMAYVGASVASGLSGPGAHAISVQFGAIKYSTSESASQSVYFDNFTIDPSGSTLLPSADASAGGRSHGGRVSIGGRVQ